MKITVLAAIALVSAAALSAQEFRGTFSGTVADTQGAGIPKATIVATETRTGAKSTAISGDSGSYTIPFLAPGEYQITAETPGFKKAVRKGMTLSAGEHPIINIQLEVGGVTESVTVSAEAPLIESASGSLGQTITTEQVEDFPVNGRMPLQLANLALGAISTIEPGPVRPFDNGTPGGGFTLGGAPSGTNEILINGSPNAAFNNQLAYSPPQDAVMEVRVNTFENDAAYGHAAGGTINQITKSGTNAFHGSAYDFNQTSFLDANSFFTNKAGNPRPAYNYNQYGVSAQGPVWIPRVFNGRNKVFWMFAWEGLRDSDPANSPIETGNPVNFATVPTAAERQGDFSSLLKLNKPGTDYTIYDPSTGVASGTQISRTPFPNNVIPGSRLNPVALNFLQYFPQPNSPGRADGLNNFAVNAIDFDNYDNELGRLDLNLSDKNKLSFDARHNYRAQNKNNYFHNIATGNYLYRVNQGSSLDEVYTISPSLVMNIRGNWTRYIEIHASPNDGLDPASLGFPASLSARAEALQLPYMVFTSTSVSAGSTPSFQALGYNGAGSNTSDVFQLFGDIVKIHGNHTIKTGADIRDYRWSAFNHGNPSGTYTFTQNWTNGPLNNAAASPLGQDFAAFLLGLPNSGSIDLNSQSTAGSKYYALFVQDDWRAKSNLTINLGLRWEHDTPTSERFGRAVNGFNPTAQNPIAAAAAAAYAANPIPQVPVSQFSALGGLTFPGSGDRNVYHTDSHIFSPRAGFAWTPAALGSKTVIRGGFGVFVAPIEIVGNGSTAYAVSLRQEGFSQTTQFVATNDNYLSPASTLSNPFPNGILSPVGAAGGAGTFLGQQIQFFNPHVRNPYSIRWDLSIQRQLPGQMVLEVAYVGNHAVHLPTTGNSSNQTDLQLDYVPRQYLSTSPFRDNATVNLLTGTVPNPFKGLLPNSSSLNGATVARQQLLIPFPQYPVGSGTSNGILMDANGGGSSYFESLNVRLQKRLTNGLTLINNFVWNKLIDRLAYLNDSDSSPEKRISSDSRPFREVFAASYELPIGHGKPLDLQSRLGNTLLGGWRINGILTLQTGPVLSSWGDVIYYGGPLNLNQHQPNGPAFDITQFNTASTQQLANNIRTFDTQFNNLRRDTTKNLDVSVGKRFLFGERKYLEARFESFNTTNRVTFGPPQLSPTNSAFGLIGAQANTPRRIQTGLRLVW